MYLSFVGNYKKYLDLLRRVGNVTPRVNVQIVKNAEIDLCRPHMSSKGDDN